MVRQVIFATLAAVGCGEGDGGGAAVTCADLAGAASAVCDTLDEATCHDQCEMQNHPQGHLDTADDCLTQATDCDSAIGCLDADFICDT